MDSIHSAPTGKQLNLLSGLQESAPKKLPLDVTARASSMPRNTALLYPNRRPKDEDSPLYLGVLTLADGMSYWAGVWVRIVNGKYVLELRLKERRRR